MDRSREDKIVVWQVKPNHFVFILSLNVKQQPQRPKTEINRYALVIRNWGLESLPALFHVLKNGPRRHTQSEGEPGNPGLLLLPGALWAGGEHTTVGITVGFAPMIGGGGGRRPARRRIERCSRGRSSRRLSALVSTAELDLGSAASDLARRCVNRILLSALEL